MIYILLICVLTSVSASPRVRTENGIISGTTYKLSNGRILDAFLGIPFAEPPIASKRFEAPQPKKPWRGIWNANETRKACVQFYVYYSFVELQGDEDCLYLNIFRPMKTDTSRLLEVLVYIHGGAYHTGSVLTTYPDYILHSSDIVYVAIPYRLGPLGFLSTNDEVAPGNNGLKDQVEALRWIQKNIYHFGGDPDRVTIHGISSGGSAVEFHLLSPLSIGLFDKAIVSSGSLFTPSSLLANVVKNSFKLASILKCPTQDTQSMMLCLKHKPLEDILEAMKKFIENEGLLNLAFGPVIEPKSASAFIIENPRYLLKNGKVRNVPLLVSTVETEGTVPGVVLHTLDNNFNKTNKNWLEIAPHMFFYNHLRSKPEQDYISSKIKEFYFQGKILSDQTTMKFFRAISDGLFVHGIIEFTKLYATVNDNNATYCYKFNYRGNASIFDKYESKINYGVSHADDQLYIVKSKSGPKPRNDDEVAKFLVSSVVNFIKNGNPSSEGIFWKPIYKNSKMNCLNIYSPTIQKMEDIENPEVTRFWNDILPPNYDAVL